MIRATLLLVLIYIGVASAAQPAGEVYAPPEGGFSVRFPAKPREAKQTAKTPLGELVVHTATYVTAESNVYLASYTDFPGDAAKRENRDTLYDGVREGLKGKDGKVLSEESVEIGPEKLPGRELILEKGKQRVRVRILVKDGRLFQVAAVGSLNFTTGTTVDGFIWSFDVTK